MSNRPTSPGRQVLATLSAALMALTACGSTSPAPTGTGHAARTIRVPQDAAGIQAGVAQAQPGDLVLIGAGVYREQVRVGVPGVVVRGLDRNSVILDGENKRANGVLLEGDGDVVENLTVHNFTGNGVLVTGTQRDGFQQQDPRVPTVVGYRVSYVTAYNNGSYGIYAFASDRGQIDHDYASGHPDSGIYVGQCANPATRWSPTTSPRTTPRGTRAPTREAAWSWCRRSGDATGSA